MSALLSTSPIRVLHVIGGLTRGGTETWLMYLLRRADRTRLEMDFLVHTDEPRPYDAEALSLGARIHRVPLKPPLFGLPQLWKVLRGPIRYDVVHSHAHFYSGWVLSVAAVAGIPVRIAHSHGDTRREDARADLPRRVYLALMSELMRRSASAGFGCSSEAGQALFGASWGRDPRWSIFRIGVDLQPFQARIQSSLRDQLGIPRDAYVIGHVGRFVEVKNHAFLVEIAKELSVLEPTAHFLLVGGGPLRNQVEHRIADARVKHCFTLAGERGDIAALMTSVMDSFVLPSFYEGLPVVLVEAQAAGLPCLVSKNVSAEARIVDDLYFQETIDASPRVWAKRLLDLRDIGKNETRQRALQMVKQSPFEINTNVHALHEQYLTLLKRARQPRRPGTAAHRTEALL